MEQEVDKILGEVAAIPNVTGILLANKQGLCIGARGEAAANTAGMVVALLEQASKLEPNLNPPTLQIKNGNKTCTIHRKSTVVGAMYKEDPK